MPLVSLFLSLLLTLGFLFYLPQEESAFCSFVSCNFPLLYQSPDGVAVSRRGKQTNKHYTTIWLNLSLSLGLYAEVVTLTSICLKVLLLFFSSLLLLLWHQHSRFIFLNVWCLLLIIYIFLLLSPSDETGRLAGAGPRRNLFLLKLWIMVITELCHSLIFWRVGLFFFFLMILYVYFNGYFSWLS